MEAVTRRNWIFARRNNIVTLAWLTPFISILFTWLLTLAEDDPVSSALGFGRLAVFQQFVVVMVYLFVNALVSFIVAAYLVSREFEDRGLSLVRLTDISPASLYFGHLRTIAAVMLPQILLFHIGIAVFYIATDPHLFSRGDVNVHMFIGILAMNLLNTAAISALVLPGIFGRSAAFILLGLFASFVAVPLDFMFFFIADDLQLPIWIPILVAFVPFASLAWLSIAWGKRRWYAEWR
jgi:hypothetical protein